MSKTIRDELKDLYIARGGQQGDLTNDSQTIGGMVKAINKSEAAAKVLTLTEVEAANDELDLWGTLVSEIQEDITVTGDKITGKLFYRDSGQIVKDWGPGYFIALHVNDIDSDATSVLVGLDPSEGSGLVELINDPDKVGMFKVTHKDSQIFKVIQSNGAVKRTQVFSLSGLTLVPANDED